MAKVVAVWGFDFDDLSAEVPEQHRAEGAVERVGKIQHANILESAWHESVPPLRNGVLE
jgi:hypothetical protein